MEGKPRMDIFKPHKSAEAIMNQIKSTDLSKMIVVGDRVLIKPLTASERTSSGLYLPPGVEEKEKVRSGYIIKAGPGYPVPVPADDDSWKSADEKVKYIPLQVREGDLALFLQRDAVEIQYSGVKYFIVHQQSILLVERDEDLLN